MTIIFLHQSLEVSKFTPYIGYYKENGNDLAGTNCMGFNLNSSQYHAPSLVNKMIIAFSFFDAFIDKTNPGFEGRAVHCSLTPA